MTPLTDDLLHDLMDSVEGRPLTVHMSRATERRLLAAHDRSGFSDETRDESLALAYAAAADCGLREFETDADVWSDMGGRLRPLPRARRAPVRSRVRYALAAAARAWRAT